VLLTGETQGYYGDYRKPRLHVTRTLAEGFAYQGEPSPHRKGDIRGEPTSALPATAFVNFLQNHDQIGNRALGERLSVLAQPVALEAALAVTLLAPAPPLMFMGDEWGAREPFPFFCDFKGDLADAVRNGRRSEFAEAYARYTDEVPDPLSEATVQLAKLDWTATEKPEHRARLDLVRRLLAARKSFVTPRLPQLQQGPGHAAFSNGVLVARWTFASGETLSMLANLSGQSRARPNTFKKGKPVWGGTPPAELPPWSVYAAIEAS
jgi:1,4-alpha-glucan branching enzyme